MQDAEPQIANDATTEPVLIDVAATGVATLTLNRPKARNALSLAMIGAMREAVAEVGGRADVSVIVIAASGPVFCAGHDLKELTARRGDGDRGRAFFAETMQRCAAMMMAIVTCPKPVIASVGGTATAAGCQLVATCDLAVASEAAHFCTPGVNIGLFCSTPMVALSRNVSRKHAMEMLLTGDLIPAARATEIGLINRVVPAEALAAETAKLAEQIAAKSAETIAIGKRAFYEQIEKPLPDAYAFAADVMTENMLARDAEEGIGAFLEKREPEWGKV